MFPIRDHNPSATTPLVTWALLVANVAIHLWVFTLSDRALWALYGDWALIPARLSAGEGWETLVTSTFLHAGWLHLAGNMLFLWIFGDNLEEALGRVRFLLFYLACGAAAGAGQWLWEPASLVPTIGASGAIAGVMGGYLLLFPKARVDVLIFLVIIIRVIPVSAWIILLGWLAIQVWSGLGADGMAGGVAYWAHVGGFVAGFVLLVPLWLARGGPAFWTRTDGAPPHPDASYGTLTPTRVPAVRRRR
jgi:membrane associated rhomboid family serine protease